MDRMDDDSLSLDDIVADINQAARNSAYPTEFIICSAIGWIEAIARVERLGEGVRAAARAAAAHALDRYGIADPAELPPVSAAKIAALTAALNDVENIDGAAERDRNASVWLARFVAEMYA